jgi:hypothetical protein
LESVGFRQPRQYRLRKLLIGRGFDQLHQKQQEAMIYAACCRDHFGDDGPSDGAQRSGQRLHGQRRKRTTMLGLAVAISVAAFADEFWAWYVAPVQPFGYEAAWLGTVTDTLYFRLLLLTLLLFPRRAATVAGLATGDLDDRGLDAGDGGRARSDDRGHPEHVQLAGRHAGRPGHVGPQ